MSTDRRRAALIVNPGSGSAGDDPVEALRVHLVEHFDLTVHETTPERGPDRCAEDALADGAELVIAAGGDGTVSAVAGVLAGGPVALGIIPRGTANSVAAALGIPDDIEGACRVLADGHRRRLDLARCGERTMLLHCSVGLHAETISDTPTEAKQRWGALAYLATGLKKLADLEPFELELDTEDHRLSCRAVAVTAANLAPKKTLVAQGPAVVCGDDGLIDVTVLAPTSLLEAVATGIHLFRTAGQEEPASRDEIGYFACRTLRIRATPPQRVLIDGEDAGMTPVSLECLPGALVVVAPPAEASRAASDLKLEGLPGLERAPARPARS
jgi:YegS/Rv2252/BmrU family lipid kinase